MGRLREAIGGVSIELESEHIVGRSPLAHLRLNRPFVSSQHAILRWSGQGWVVSDKSSHNGTTLDGVPLRSGTSYELKHNSRLTFGHADEHWILVDDSPPNIMAVSDTGEVALADGNVIGIPSHEAPLACIFKDADGAWRLEHAEEPMATLENGASFDVQGQRWRFCHPEAVLATRTTDELPILTPSELHFRVSADEEYVELHEESCGEVRDLGHRSHNYLLLTLARARLRDAALDLPASSCGWEDKNDLALALRMTPQQIDVEIFRIRKHFGHRGLAGAAIIERRPRARQIRIGISSLRITRI